VFADFIVETRHPERRGRDANDALAFGGLVYGVLCDHRAWIEFGYRYSIDSVIAAATRRRSRRLRPARAVTTCGHVEIEVPVSRLAALPMHCFRPA
jgi:hypothetical protein